MISKPHPRRRREERGVNTSRPWTKKRWKEQQEG
jgi:hypothetical protein